MASVVGQVGWEDHVEPDVKKLLNKIGIQKALVQA